MNLLCVLTLIVPLVSSRAPPVLLGTYEGRSSVYSFGATAPSEVAVDNIDFRLQFYSQNGSFLRASLFQRRDSLNIASYTYESDVYGILAEDVDLRRWSIQLRQFVNAASTGGNFTKGTFSGYLNSEGKIHVQYLGESDSADAFSGFTAVFTRIR